MLPRHIIDGSGCSSARIYGRFRSAPVTACLAGGAVFASLTHSAAGQFLL